MKVITKTILEDYPLNKITKLVFNKTLEKEDIVEGVIINKGNASVILEGVQDLSKGKPLITKKLIEGNFLILLDKNNFDILVEANYEYVQAEDIKGNKVKDLYKFISEDKNKNKYLVEI
jgi:hypothetical protein